MVVQPGAAASSATADTLICSNLRSLELPPSASSSNSTMLMPCLSSIVSAQHGSSALITNTGSTSSRTSSTATAQLMLNGLVSNCVTNLNSQQEHHHQLLSDDSRTLQLALELSMVSLNETAGAGSVTIPSSTPIMSANNTHKNANGAGAMISNPSMHFINYQQKLQQKHQQQLVQNHQLQQHQSTISNAKLQQQQFDLTALNIAVSTSNVNANLNPNNNNGINSFPAATVSLLPSIDDRSKKSQNMTECVPVPSSEHVAEIVGRQGCKIKALRAKTNTYIKTPVRGEEPVFVVTGRKEDVAKAKREILSAAEHFSLIRATRKPSFDGGLIENNNSNVNNNGVSTGCGKAPPGPPSIPGQVTIQVRVPYRVVGLVVGPKGATIKHIQHQTQTYIVTPSREKEPIFEVTGMPDNVQSARKQIEAHIALRTGNLPLTGGSGSVVIGNTNGAAVVSNVANDTLSAVQSLSALSQMLNDATTGPDLLASLYKSDGIRSAFDYLESSNGVATATTGVAMSDVTLSIGASGNGMNFNISCDNHDGVIGNGGNNCPNNVDSINLANQLCINSIGNCTNFQLQNLNNANQSTDYLNSLINNCNLNGGGNNSKVTDITEFEVGHHKQQQKLRTSLSQASSLNIRPQSSSSTPHGQFANNITSCASLSTTAINAINLTALVNNVAANSCVGTGNGGNHITTNATNSNNHNSNSGNINSSSGCMARSCSSASSTASSKSTNNSGSGSSCNNSNSSRPELINIWKNLGDSLDVDEGIGDSPSIWTLPTPLATLNGSHCSPSTSISPTDSLLGEISSSNHHNHTNTISNIISGNAQHESNSQKNIQSQSLKHQLNIDCLQTIINASGIRRECLVCADKEITAVLVPCGHNMFCMDCANRICTSEDAICPVCSLTVYHAMRILA